MIDTEALREQLPYLLPQVAIARRNQTERPRISLDSTATTPPTVEALDALVTAAFSYGPFERGGSDAGIKTSMAVLHTYNILANLLGTDSWKQIVLGRNTTEMIGHVAHALQGEFEGFSRFRSGENVVITQLEHNSNYLPWRELVQFLLGWGVSVELRIARVNRESGEVDMADLERKIDRKTRVVAVTGKSNVMGTVPEIAEIGKLAHRYGALFMVDAAQYVPGHYVDVNALDVDLLTFSMHKMLGPWGVGVLYGKRDLLEKMPPFLPGGGTVSVIAGNKVMYHGLPQKFIAGSPDSLGIIAAGASLEVFLSAGLNLLGKDQKVQRAFTKMVINAPSAEWEYQYHVDRPEGDAIREYATQARMEYVLGDHTRRRAYARELVEKAMKNIAAHQIALTERVLEGLHGIHGVTVYGTLPAEKRYGLVTFNVAGLEARQVGFSLSQQKIDVRADKHCAHLLHDDVLKVDGTTRVSLAMYNTPSEVDAFLHAVREVSRNV